MQLAEPMNRCSCSNNSSIASNDILAEMPTKRVGVMVIQIILMVVSACFISRKKYRCLFLNLGGRATWRGFCRLGFLKVSWSASASKWRCSTWPCDRCTLGPPISSSPHSFTSPPPFSNERYFRASHFRSSIMCSSLNAPVTTPNANVPFRTISIFTVCMPDCGSGASVLIFLQMSLYILRMVLPFIQKKVLFYQIRGKLMSSAGPFLDFICTSSSQFLTQLHPPFPQLHPPSPSLTTSLSYLFKLSSKGGFFQVGMVWVGGSCWLQVIGWMRFGTAYVRWGGDFYFWERGCAGGCCFMCGERRLVMRLRIWAALLTSSLLSTTQSFSNAYVNPCTRLSLSMSKCAVAACKLSSCLSTYSNT